MPSRSWSEASCDELDRLADAKAVGFGIDDADIQSLRGGVGRDVAHAEHGQREVVCPGTQAVVT
jgi:hypothetical protein